MGHCCRLSVIAECIGVHFATGRRIGPPRRSHCASTCVCAASVHSSPYHPRPASTSRPNALRATSRLAAYMRHTCVRRVARVTSVRWGRCTCSVTTISVYFLLKFTYSVRQRRAHCAWHTVRRSSCTANPASGRYSKSSCLSDLAEPAAPLQLSRGAGRRRPRTCQC